MISATPLPPLQGSRLRLQTMQPADITPEHVAWLQDPEVVRFSNQRFLNHTLDSCRHYLASFTGSPNLYASVRLLPEDRRIGSLTAYRSLQHGTADIGILIGERSAWGRGLGTEAFGLLADWLSAQPGMRKLTCGMLAINHGMIGIASRTGFECEAVRAAQEVVDGIPVDMLLFARFVHA